MAKGGKRSGAGRKRGPSERTVKLKARLDRLLPDDKLIKILITLAEGEKRQVFDGKLGELRTVKDRGDGHVATWLGDRKWGRVPQPVQGTDDGAPQVRVIVDNRLGIQYRRRP